jgi:hypothetical protein
MEWAALVVSIFSALGAAIAGYFAYVANRNSRNANELAREANDIAAQGNQQAERSFLESGSLVDVGLSWRGALVVRVMSTGRIAAVVHDILLECDSDDGAHRLPAVGSNPTVPVSLEPTRHAEFVVDRQVLASLSGRYGGMHAWRAAAELGDGRKFWSNAVDVLHPAEPPFEQMLNDLNLAAHHLIGAIRTSSAPGSSEALRDIYRDLHGQLARLDARYDALPVRSGTWATQLVNARRTLKEAHTMLGAP